MTDIPPEVVQKMLRDEFATRILSGAVIVANAVSSTLGDYQNDQEWIKANFSDLVERIQTTAYEAYLESELAAGGTALHTVFLNLAGDYPTADTVLRLLERNFTALDKFFLGLTQGRRPRAGNAFEVLIKELFQRLGYPFTARPVIDGRPDFILPSVQHYRDNPLDCIIFTIKRTLRERWRQIVTEGSKSLGFYLATIDENVSKSDLADMVRSKIHLVVPRRLKENIEHYAAAGNVIAFETFFEHHLDPAMRRWLVG